LGSRALFAAPILLAIGLHAWASGAYAPDALLFALALAGIPLGGRVSLGTTATRVLGVLFFAGGAVLGWSHLPQLGYGPGALPRTASLIAVGSLLCASSRLYASEAWARERATFILGTVAVTACGATRLGPAYVASAMAYVVLALLALRMRDPARAHAPDLGLRHRVALASAAFLACSIAFAFARVVPPLNNAVEKAIERKFVLHDMVGFGAGSSLGEMRDMIQSDVEVLRVTPQRGRSIDYLRGAVFDQYRSDGFWSESPPAEQPHDATVGNELAPAGTAVRIRRVAGTPGRYFLPLDARDVRVATGQLVVDQLGSTFTVGSDHVTEYTFALGAREKLRVAAPSRTDLYVPRSERDALGRLAREWTAPAPTDEEKLAALQANLGHGYQYSLTPDGAGARSDDPLLDFLFQGKVGYCTYFASAMTMLARSSGIPARLVTGYRVAEWSPVAHEFVVREKNAHAWVEAWVNGEWRTYDPTPLQELPQDRTHITSLATLVGDSVAWSEHAVAYAVSHVTPAQLFAVLAALGAMWVGVRWLGRRANRGQRARVEDQLDRPLPWFASLASSLERRGLLRDRAEPLELFARRLEGLGLREAAQLVDRYAALRYGGLGDPSGLERDVEQFVRGGASP
jgi:transglutaminase-like putative cysteine protease